MTAVELSRSHNRSELYRLKKYRNEKKKEIKGLEAQIDNMFSDFEEHISFKDKSVPFRDRNNLFRDNDIFSKSEGNHITNRGKTGEKSLSSISDGTKQAVGKIALTVATGGAGAAADSKFSNNPTGEKFSGGSVSEKFEVSSGANTQLVSTGNSTVKSVNSYFEKDDPAKQSGNFEVEKSLDAKHEELQERRSEKKAADADIKKARRRAAAMAAVSKLIQFKRDTQNEINGEVSGDLIKDGSGGIIKSIMISTKSSASQTFGALIMQLLAVVGSLLGSFVIPFVVAFSVVFLIWGIFMLFIGVGVDDSGTIVPPGDGYVYASLSDDEIEDIIDDLNGEDDDELSYEQEILLRYALSKVGCEYNQDYHLNLAEDIFDCSSLVYRAYQELGIDISCAGYFSAAEEFRAAYLSSCIVDGFEPGDLIFYGGANNGRFAGVYHVGIYIGDGKMVEARGRSWGVVYSDVRSTNLIGVARYI